MRDAAAAALSRRRVLVGSVINPGAVVEMKTRRTYFLDYPCDLKPGEKVTFILSLHGGGSYGNWQRHYFPIMDYKDKYRLVIATPNSPTRAWSAADDEYLQNIVDVGRRAARPGEHQGVLAGRALAGRHDLQPARAHRLLQGQGRRLAQPVRRPAGRTAGPRVEFRHGRSAPAAARWPCAVAAPGPGPGGGSGGACASCRRRLLVHLRDGPARDGRQGRARASEWAAKYGCGPKRTPEEIVDTKAGYIYDGSAAESAESSVGTAAAARQGQIYVYPDCKDGRVVADVVRLDKGHTEGLEPKVTEELVKLMLSAKGGKLQ